MSRELLILRHAKSAWDTPAETDFDRPLNGRGKRDAPRIGAWLMAQALLPDHVIASPARRARQTTRRVCKELGLDASKVDGLLEGVDTILHKFSLDGAALKKRTEREWKSREVDVATTRRL